ncbi:hypothetical protein [Rhodovulum sp. YEN HP10]|uniref:hypothetical protein n=1 Tax=Rhodovulum sp. HP10 TaxID=3387397 RepID=UPI0039E0E8A4
MKTLKITGIKAGPSLLAPARRDRLGGTCRVTLRHLVARGFFLLNSSGFQRTFFRPFRLRTKDGACIGRIEAGAGCRFPFFFGGSVIFAKLKLTFLNRRLKPDAHCNCRSE